ncbi:MAG: hypothetical protein PHE24_05040 [Patescibacteria group bacterium]|nr:hypothetical protein [Patescibacteria group bacterium]
MAKKTYTVVRIKFGRPIGEIAESMKKSGIFPDVKTKPDHASLIVLEGEFQPDVIDPFFHGQDHDYYLISTNKDPFELL